jgi:hypothetical protein
VEPTTWRALSCREWSADVFQRDALARTSPEIRVLEYGAMKLPAGEIRSFRIRGNYPNHSRLVHSMEGRHTERGKVPQKLPGYSPAVAEFVVGGPGGDVSGSIAVRDLDLLPLCQRDVEAARRHLSLLLAARAGDREAADALSVSVQEHIPYPRTGLRSLEQGTSRMVIPCTSREVYPEQAVSHKGSILLRLSQLGYPVPDFVILTTEAYLRNGTDLDAHLSDALHQLEDLTCQTLGATDDPLIFALRCATPFYVAGVMPTFLNVGVTEATLPGLEDVFGAEPAHRMFLNNLRNIHAALDREGSDALPSAIGPQLAPEEVVDLIRRISAEIRRTDPALVEDPFSQAAFLIRQSYQYFEDNQDLLLTLSRGARCHPAVILQKMVCTVRDEEAYAGVLFSRHCRTGVGMQLETAHNIFGEEIMTGTTETNQTAFEDNQSIKDSFPAVHHFVPHLTELETLFESPVTIEFAVDATKNHQLFALLQLNESGMVGRAALISVVDLHKSGAISRRRVTELICPYHIKQIESDAIDDLSFQTLARFCSGVAILPRAAVSARIYFTADAALRAKRHREKVCFCKKTFAPNDTVVMREVDAIVSLTSAAIHVVTTCQSFGVPALLSLEKEGVSLEPDGRLINAAGREISEGDWITISSSRQALYEGKAKFKPARLVRYMRGEPVPLEEEEKSAFAEMAYAYRYYQQLVRGLKLDQISTLNEVIRLVNLELRGEPDEARRLVNGWFDSHEAVYVEEVLKSELGDHLNQHTVFDMLTLERKIRFFKRALERCYREQISGYAAGAFMLGRFISSPQPVGFWRAFAVFEVALLVNEWILFEQYMQVLNDVGDRRILRVRKTLLSGGLEEISLHPRSLRCLMQLKLCGVGLESIRAALPEWSNRQAAKVIDLLQLPYRAFYDFGSEWSVGELRNICREEALPVPAPDDV